MNARPAVSVVDAAVCESFPQARCINIDWLEVYVLEPLRTPHDAQFFREQGFIVHERDYGTRMYHEMFVLEGTDGLPLLEVRRRPKSAKDFCGIHDINGSHIRLVNRTCYFDNAAAIMSEFLSRYDYTFSRISRVDICLDFARFDRGDDPAKFMRRYMMERFTKINQADISSHGRDTWEQRCWNSVSWGSPKSQVTTKFYCKSLELKQKKDKPYIRQAWFESGLIDNPINVTKRDKDGNEKPVTVWRVEFSIASSVKGWYVVEEDGNARKKHSYRNTLDMYAGRANLIAVFSSLAKHYFHFKIYEKDKRKDRCADKVLFVWKPDETFYHVEHPAGTIGRDRELEHLRIKLERFKALHGAADVRSSCDILIRAISDDVMRNDLVNPFSQAELLALRTAISMRAAGDTRDPANIISSVRQFLIDNLDAPPFM